MSAEHSNALSIVVVNYAADERLRLADDLTSLGVSVYRAAVTDDVLGILENHKVDAAIIDVDIKTQTFFGLAEELRLLYPHLLIVFTTSSDVSFLFHQTMRATGNDILNKPWTPQNLRELVGFVRTRSASGHGYGQGDDDFICNSQIEKKLSRLIGSSQYRRKVASLIRSLGRSRAPMLIAGDIGTGAEIVVDLIEKHTTDSEDRQFVKFNCACESADRIAHELFGGPMKPPEELTTGILAEAAGGTLFLVRAMYLPDPVQKWFDRFLDGPRVIGRSGRPLQIIASSSSDIDTFVRDGRFRVGLYQALNAVRINLPHLAGNIDEIRSITRSILQQTSERDGIQYSIDDDAMFALTCHRWPENAFDLDRALAYASSRASGGRITRRFLPKEVLRSYSAALRTDKVQRDREKLDRFIGLPLDVVERHHIMNVLERCEGDKDLTARQLRIGRTTLFRKLKEYHSAGHHVPFFA